MSGVIYHVLDIHGDSVIKLSEQQLEDVELRIRWAHESAQFKGLSRDQLLALGNMKIIEIEDPDLCWD